MKKYTHEKAHEEIDYIFKTLLPQRGMAERPEQIRLCHSILDAMLDGSIALCDAGTGIGKTFAYLTAGILHGKCRAAEGKPQRPILISTSSIALQSAIQKEYLPLLSSVLLSEGLISAPIEASDWSGGSGRWRAAIRIPPPAKPCTPPGMCWIWTSCPG